MPDRIAPDDALLLDIDGTLIDIAETPDAVVVPTELRRTLRALREALGGALALVSGRPLDQIDALFALPDIACAAEHGGLLRLPGGGIRRSGRALPDRVGWRATIEAEARGWPGALVEAKTYSLVVHFRRNPALAERVAGFLARLVAGHEASVEILSARMAFELRPRGIGKDGAVASLMREAPFAGRHAVYVGDDTTDEPAIALVAAMGGTGLHVARDFAGSPAAVRQWLGAGLAGLDRMAAHG